MNSPYRVTPFLIGLLVDIMLLSSPVGGFAQTPNPSALDSNTKNKPEIIACPYYVTFVRVKVSNRIGGEISDLTKDEFIVYEDGVRQELMWWTSEDGNSELEGKQAGYEMAYYPLKYPFDGMFRRIRVVVRPAYGKEKLSVEFSPHGYFANKELLR